MALTGAEYDRIVNRLKGARGMGKITSRKLAAIIAGILAEVGVVAIIAFQGSVGTEQANLAMLLIAGLAGGAAAVQGAIDYKNGKP